MIVLVDYANLDAVDASRGVAYVVSKILDTIGAAHFSQGERVRVRMYGGWYDGKALSRQAQRLSADIANAFPSPVVVSDQSKKVTLSVSAEMAYSMEIDPKTMLVNTFRPRGAPPNLVCATPPFSGCSSPGSCPIAALHGLFQNNRCPTPSCMVEPAKVLSRAEQKLVDTMIVADLIHVAKAPPNTVALVSTDDDMWPGVRTALSLGARVIHVHPRRGRKTPPYYAANSGPSYIERTFI